MEKARQSGFIQEQPEIPRGPKRTYNKEVIPKLTLNGEFIQQKIGQKMKSRDLLHALAIERGLPNIKPEQLKTAKRKLGLSRKNLSKANQEEIRRTIEERQKDGKATEFYYNDHEGQPKKVTKRQVDNALKKKNVNSGRHKKARPRSPKLKIYPKTPSQDETNSQFDDEVLNHPSTSDTSMNNSICGSEPYHSEHLTTSDYSPTPSNATLGSPIWSACSKAGSVMEGYEDTPMQDVHSIEDSNAPIQDIGDASDTEILDYTPSRSIESEIAEAEFDRLGYEFLEDFETWIEKEELIAKGELTMGFSIDGKKLPTSVYESIIEGPDPEKYKDFVEGELDSRKLNWITTIKFYRDYYPQLLNHITIYGSHKENPYYITFRQQIAHIPRLLKLYGPDHYLTIFTLLKFAETFIKFIGDIDIVHIYELAIYGFKQNGIDRLTPGCSLWLDGTRSLRVHASALGARGNAKMMEEAYKLSKSNYKFYKANHTKNHLSSFKLRSVQARVAYRYGEIDEAKYILEKLQTRIKKYLSGNAENGTAQFDIKVATIKVGIADLLLSLGKEDCRLLQQANRLYSEAIICYYQDIKTEERLFKIDHSQSNIKNPMLTKKLRRMYKVFGKLGETNLYDSNFKEAYINSLRALKFELSVFGEHDYRTISTRNRLRNVVSQMSAIYRPEYQIQPIGEDEENQVDGTQLACVYPDEITMHE